MNFNQVVIWPYDPIVSISNIRVQQNSTPYIHIPKPEIKKFCNKRHAKRILYKKHNIKTNTVTSTVVGVREGMMQQNKK